MVKVHELTFGAALYMPLKHKKHLNVQKTVKI